MVSVLMHQNSAAKSHHLISQGTADIILDSCIDVWTGHDLEALSEDGTYNFYNNLPYSALKSAKVQNNS